MIIPLPARGQVVAKTPDVQTNAKFYKNIFET